MYQPLDTLTLRSGERVAAGVVRAPDLDWALRVERLLHHKGEPWNWQNARVLERTLGIDANFYILHRDGTPFANILICTVNGVGLLGHVWTAPDDRRQGASSQLLRVALDDFHQRNGQALMLTTDSPVAAGIYAQVGFRTIEPGSEIMVYYPVSQAAFEREYFAADEITIQPLAWNHWPVSSFLFAGDFPGVVRCAPLGLMGRDLTEEALLPLLQDAEQRRASDQPPRAVALQNVRTRAMVGFAAWDWHPIWPETCLVDVYCHPAFWERGGDLLAALDLPDARRILAYGDPSCPQKHEILHRAGFHHVNTLPQWIPADAAGSAQTDVLLFTK